MKTFFKNKSLSAVLCLFAVVSVLLVGVIAVTNEPFVITHQGAQAELLEFEQDDKATVGLDGIPADSELQWQICMDDGETWVNISGQTKEELTVSYALIGSIMDSYGRTAIRCVATQNETKFITDPVPVHMSFTVDHIQSQAPTAAQPVLTVNSLTQHTMLNQGNLMPLAEDANSMDLVTIKVYYKYGSIDGNEVFTSYTAQIQKGATFWTTVASPTVPGYRPGNLSDQIEGVTLDADGNVAFDITAVNEDIEITVIYVPTTVTYRVSYYYQNIDNDLYTYADTQTYTGLTDTVPTNGITNKDAPGFTLLRYDIVEGTATIAADGSTHINCYFDRNYYLVNFKLEGGHGVEPVYARYGTTLFIPTPVRAGYSFMGWDLVSIVNNDVPITTHTHIDENGVETTYPVPAEDGQADTLNPAVGICIHGDHLLGNYTYKAIWGHDATTFTVVYWVQNADDDSYSYAHSINNVSAFTGDIINLSTVTNHKYTLSDVEYTVETALPDDNALKAYSDLVNDIYTDANGASIATPYSSDYNKHDLSGDYGVVVEGNGSTVFNIYFTRKEYTLKFYYAMATDQYIYVIGGSTYHFGSLATAEDKNNEIALLDSYMSTHNSTRGWVDEIPELNATGTARYGDRNTVLTQFDTSRVNNEDYKYYYLKFSARYGADISALWPSDVFNSVTRKVGNSHGNWSGMEAFASAWNGEYNVKYTQDTSINNGNQTIKGKYSQLDANLLWEDMSQNTDNTISFLCFWENGGDIGWSVPELYRYNIYLECLEGVDYSDKSTETINGVTYYLADSYDTCDDSEVQTQTQPGLVGYHKGADRTSSRITNFDSSLFKEAYNVNFYYLRNRDKTLALESYGETCLEVTPAYGISLGLYIKDLSLANYPDSLEPNAYEFSGWYTGPKASGYKVVINNTIDHDNDGVIDENYYDTTNMIWYNPTMHDNNLILFAHWKPIQRTVKFHYLYTDIGVNEPLMTATPNHGEPVANQDAPAEPTREGYDFIGWFYIDDDGEKSVFHVAEMAVREDLDLYAEWKSIRSAPYTVQYLDAADRTTVLAEPTTGSAFLGSTKTFTAKYGDELVSAGDGYVYFPDSASKSLLITENGTNNVITFYYTKVAKVWYTVKYLDAVTGLQLADDYSAQSESAIITVSALTGDELKNSNGKTYIPQQYYITKVLSSNEEENVIIFYYIEEKEKGGIVVNHYIQNVDGNGYTKLQSNYYTSVAEDDEGNAVTVYVKDYLLSLTGFEWDKGAYNNSNTNPISDTVKVGDVIHLDAYYTRNSYRYTVKYMAVNSTIEIADPDDGTALYQQSVTFTVPESKKTITRDLVKYNLMGSGTQTITISEDEEENVIIFYYEPVKTTLTINTKIVDADGNTIPSSDSFLFTIHGPLEMGDEIGNITISVAVQGNGSVIIGDLPTQVNLPSQGLYVGTYEVTPLTGWSYQYDLKTVEGGTEASSGKWNIILDQDTVDEMTFTFQYVGSDWLGGEAYRENVFDLISSQTD